MKLISLVSRGTRIQEMVWSALTKVSKLCLQPPQQFYKFHFLAVSLPAVSLRFGPLR